MCEKQVKIKEQVEEAVCFLGFFSAVCAADGAEQLPGEQAAAFPVCSHITEAYSPKLSHTCHPGALHESVQKHAC